MTTCHARSAVLDCKTALLAWQNGLFRNAKRAVLKAMPPQAGPKARRPARAIRRSRFSANGLMARKHMQAALYFPSFYTEIANAPRCRRLASTLLNRRREKPVSARGRRRPGKRGGATSPHGQGNKNPARGHWRGSTLPFAGFTVTDACRHAPGRVTSPCHRPSASCRP